MNQKIALLAPLACCALATCTEEPSVTLTPVEEWTTEPEYEIGDQMEGDALFARISSVVPTPDGSRVYVLDRQAFEVTIWTPDGALIGRVGRAGDGPGDFASPGSLFLFDDGFQVAEGLRITTFSLDGDLVRADGLERAMNPSGDASFGRLYHAIAMFRDRSVGAVSAADLVGSGSVTEEMSEDAHPVVRITQDNGSFRVDTLGLLGYRDVWLALGSRGSFAVRQPFVSPDDFVMDPWDGSVVFSRSLGTPPGLLELIEVSTAGDTVWTRRIHLPPIPVTEDEIYAAADEFAAYLADGTPAQKRDAVRDRMIIPEYWPATLAIGLQSNGEIWFRPAGEDDSRIWYAVRKREDEGPIRRIVVPESFRPLDANATHVWGVRTDEMGVQYVAGLRLVRTS
ncbi:MAG: hypothetical protein F4139_04640 [Gemmatimonadetes bacterium]|nr:hypothetical protein [Gemmatimonadota bacterium]MYA64447.1 hypothetical protein [Gemmatimonadota bacterium]MYB99976.1 hypothetical protein [Gemmatimonadota bacterium]MYH52224.1 hypothetical protein [Gemmatimonadota bacterium]MYK65719.1 hypothetical protein [Gemmatimonadota bacterium]